MSEANIPPGMVPLDDGAFDNGNDILFVLKHVIPAEFAPFGLDIGFSKTLSDKLRKSAPLATLKSKTIFDQIKEGKEEKEGEEDVWEKVRDKFAVSSDPDVRCDKTQYECRTVAMYSLYPKGVDWWGTPSLSMKNLFDYAKSFFDSAKIMDEAPANDATSFINNYFSKKNPDGKRKRFPVIFSIYFSGLDHEAHGNGMEGYKTFFKSTTDAQIKYFVDALKTQGEFDNKIFIIVADHGMTAMPEFEDVTLPSGEVVKPDNSCKLNVNNFGDAIIQAREKENNNLHIW